MSWEEAQCAIQTWVKCAGLSPYWINQYCKIKCEPYVELNISDISEVGRDFTDYVEEDGQLVPVVCSRTEFLLTLRIDTTRHSPDHNAMALMNRVRMALELPEARAALRGAGLSFIRSSSIRRLDYERLDEMVSRASLDMVFNKTTALKGCPTDYIEKISVTSQETVEGTLVDPDLQLTQEQMP